MIDRPRTDRQVGSGVGDGSVVAGVVVGAVAEVFDSADICACEFTGADADLLLTGFADFADVERSDFVSLALDPFSDESADTGTNPAGRSLECTKAD